MNPPPPPEPPKPSPAPLSPGLPRARGDAAMPPSRDSGLSRRDALRGALAAAGLSALAFEPDARAAQPPRTPDARRGSPKRYDMKKSINLWAFPYPQRMNLRECLQLAKDAGFEGIELNYDLDNDLSPSSGPREYAAIRKLADDIGIEISGLCSFLFWPYPLTSNDPVKRERGLELAGKIAQAAPDLGADNVPGGPRGRGPTPGAGAARAGPWAGSPRRRSGSRSSSTSRTSSSTASS